MSERYRLGPYVVDVDERTIYRGAQPVALKLKAFDVLTCLLRHPNETVTHEQLREEVWGTEGSSSNNVAQHLFMVRAALGETASLIQTVPRTGYRLTAQPQQLTMPESPSLAARLETIANGLMSSRTAGSLHRAIDAYREMLALDGRSVPALTGLARAHLRLIETGEAEPLDAVKSAASYVNAAREAAPDDPGVLTVAAHVHVNRLAWSEASECVTEALRRGATDAPLVLLELLLRTGRLDEALHAAAQYAPLHVTDERFALSHACAFYFSGDFDTAREHFERLIALRRTFSEARARLAQTLFAAGATKDALWHAREVTRERGDTAFIHTAAYDAALALRIIIGDETVGDELPAGSSGRALVEISRNPIEAQRLLVEGIERREAAARYAAVQPLFAPLRSPAVYAALNLPIL